MHQIKLFSGTSNVYGIQRLQQEINDWLRESKTVFNALVIHNTDMIESNGVIVYSIYYTFLPNEPKKDSAGIDARAAG